ncbi:Membrane-associated phospholipid phosphatase [Spirosomataceae bacterium TFI 002]|nr:Membrane-associated phospholipid phosphatase [Spirosomataceae bacterium TFI 002]
MKETLVFVSRKLRDSVLGICITISLLVVSFTVNAQHIDIDVLERIHQPGQSQANQFYQGLTTSADYVAVLTPVTMLGTGLLSKNKELTRKGIQSGIAVLGTYGVGYILKKTVNRSRPWQDYPQIMPYQFDDGASFPSGSTAVAFAAATSLTTSFPKWYVAVPAYTYASAVGYSRLRLGAHYPSDVLAGAVIGTASVWVSGKLTKLINK